MSRLRRLYHSARFTLCRGSKRKKAYADGHKLFAGYGFGVTYQPHILPLYSRLIKIHNNVVVGRNVEFVTHDVIHKVFNGSAACPSGYKERVGCIEIMDDVFIGNGAIIMYGVRIAERNIIAAGSVVTKSTEPDSVYAGVPARKIGSFTELATRRQRWEAEGAIPLIAHNANISDDEIDRAWELFYDSTKAQFSN